MCEDKIFLVFEGIILLVFEGMILLVGRNNLPCVRRYKKNCYKWFFVVFFLTKKGLSRCSKLIAYMNLIKKVMLSNASTPYFGPYAQLSSVV